MKLWKTDDDKSVYKNYEMPPGIEEDGKGIVRYSFKCLKCVFSLRMFIVHSAYLISSRCTNHVVRRACYDNSTSNLWDHVKNMHREREVDQGMLVQSAHGSTYTAERLRLYEVFWCASAARPFAIITDEWFIKILEMFNPAVHTWSDVTIGRDVCEIHGIGQKNISKVIAVSFLYPLTMFAILVAYYCLQTAPGRKHLAFDGWTAANSLTFIGLNLYLILDGQLRSILLDYIPIETAHSGQDIAEHVHAAIQTYGLETSVSYSCSLVYYKC